MEPFAGSQIRAIEAVDAIGTTVIQSNSSVQEAALEIPFSSPAYLDINNASFKSWSSMFGPQQQHGDLFTNILRQPLDHNNSTVMSQYFAAEDILLLTDAYCASTCSLFAEELKTQAGVKSVVVGGRPEYGPMQAVSGIRGSQVYSAESMQEIFCTITSVNASTAPFFPSPYNYDPPINVDVESVEFNIRNQIRRSAPDVPLQFTYQAADCRIFYTAAMLADYSVLWQTAADALWSNNGLCVKGSTRHPSTGNITSLEAPNSTTSETGSATGTGTPRPSGTTITSQSSANILGVRFGFVALGCVLTIALL